MLENLLQFLQDRNHPANTRQTKISLLQMRLRKQKQLTMLIYGNIDES